MKSYRHLNPSLIVRDHSKDDASRPRPRPRPRTNITAKKRTAAAATTTTVDAAAVVWMDSRLGTPGANVTSRSSIYTTP